MMRVLLSIGNKAGDTLKRFESVSPLPLQRSTETVVRYLVFVECMNYELVTDYLVIRFTDTDPLTSTSRALRAPGSSLSPLSTYQCLMLVLR